MRRVMFSFAPLAGVFVVAALLAVAGLGQPSTLGLLGGNFQPLTPPDPFHPLDVHHPASLVQHRGDAAIAVAAILESKRDDVGGQGRLVIRGRRDLALRGSMLPENPACPPFGHAKLINHMIHTGTAACGA